MKRNLTLFVVLLVALPKMTFSQMEPGIPPRHAFKKRYATSC